MRRTLDSVTSQDFEGWIECIVVDAAAYSAAPFLPPGSEGSIRVVTASGERVYEQLDAGLRACRGEIVTWLEPPLCWLTRTATALQALRSAHQDADVLTGCVAELDSEGDVVALHAATEWQLRRALVDLDPSVFPRAGFIRREALARAGGLHQDWDYREDLWLRLARAGARFRRENVILALSRGRTASPEPLRQVRARVSMVRRFLSEPGLPPELQSLRRAAIGNAYLRGFSFLRPLLPWRWSLSVLLTARALQFNAAATARALEAGAGQSYGRLAALPRRLVESFVRFSPRNLRWPIYHACESVWMLIGGGRKLRHSLGLLGLLTAMAGLSALALLALVLPASSARDLAALALQVLTPLLMLVIGLALRRRW
jgi:hypothetical protein